ncbi:MAG: hypothetical protein Q8O67_29200 [Deltaproteobacteria bacterium]|nr:hypothetical protein [Deltaproteobacteria bacterium]
MSGAGVVVVAALLAVGMPLPQEVARRYAGAVVVVERAVPDRAPQKSHGFFVSSAGLLCSLLPGAREGDAVIVHADKAEDGVVVVVDGDGLALVQVKGVVDVAALGVSAKETPTRWLVGLARADGGVQGMLGGLEAALPNQGDRWRVMLPLPRGAPILDEHNDVVAIAVKGLGGGLIEALPVRHLKALAAKLNKS